MDGAQSIKRIFAGLGLPLALAFGGLAAAQPAQPRPSAARAEAVFAGGCFWSMETDFEHLAGVIDAIDGYTGGHVRNPSYEQVSSETTGHYEAVRVIYDPARLSYAQLVDYFWRHIDPTDSGGQVCDRGPSYRTAIFVANPGQRAAAEASKAAIERAHALRRPIATQILPLGPFYQAEAYHQNYARRNPIAYRAYRAGCGRDARVRQVWANAPR